MSTTRIALAAVGAFVSYFILGGLLSVPPALRNEFLKYPGVYRTRDAMMHVMPAGMAAMFLSMLVLAVLYAMAYKGGSGLAEGARFGALIGAFAVCAFVVHNYVNLNVGLTLTLQQSAVYFILWLVVGVAIGLIYRAPTPIP
jgi:hypothetical protein